MLLSHIGASTDGELDLGDEMKTSRQKWNFVARSESGAYRYENTKSSATFELIASGSASDRMGAQMRI